MNVNCNGNAIQADQRVGNVEHIGRRIDLKILNAVGLQDGGKGRLVGKHDKGIGRGDRIHLNGVIDIAHAAIIDGQEPPARRQEHKIGRCEVRGHMNAVREGDIGGAVIKIRQIGQREIVPQHHYHSAVGVVGPVGGVRGEEGEISINRIGGHVEGVVLKRVGANAVGANVISEGNVIG